MDTKTMINQLKCEAEKHKNDRLFTGQTNITALCNDVIPKLEKLAEYETAEEEGRLLIFPVALGDKVYVIDKYVNSGEWHLSNYEHIVTDILLNRNREPLFRIINRGGTEKFENFGKTIFLIREEAEKALEAVKKNNATN